jgi:hypothetical protein
MTSKNAWTAAGVLALVLVIVGISSLSAQRFGPSPAAGGGGDVGRYVLVRNTEDAIIIMDSVSGDLYRAAPADIKPYAARHRFIEMKTEGKTEEKRTEEKKTEEKKK